MASALAHCVPGRSLLAVSSRAHSWHVCVCAHSWHRVSWHRVLSALARGRLCARSRPLALACTWHRVRSLMASCPLCARSRLPLRSLAAARACTWHRVCARRHSVVVALIAPHVTCKRSMWNNEIIVCLARSKMKQNADVFLVYLKPWYCFYIRLKHQRLRGKKARQTSKP